MAKPSAPLFPQRLQVVNAGLRRTRIADALAEIHTGLGVLTVPLAWWLKHQNDPSFVLVVTAIEAAPRHVGATHGDVEEASA